MNYACPRSGGGGDMQEESAKIGNRGRGPTFGGTAVRAGWSWGRGPTPSTILRVYVVNVTFRGLYNRHPIKTRLVTRET
jgi:hypothetical protein